MNEVNSSQWKSIIMKVDDSTKNQNKDKAEMGNDGKNFKLKLKEHGLEKMNKSYLNTVHGKFMVHPHSYRENTKSPKFKRYIVHEDESIIAKKGENPKNVSSVKNFTNQNY